MVIQKRKKVRGLEGKPLGRKGKHPGGKGKPGGLKGKPLGRKGKPLGRKGKPGEHEGKPGGLEGKFGRLEGKPGGRKGKPWGSEGKLGGLEGKPWVRKRKAGGLKGTPGGLEGKLVGREPMERRKHRGGVSNRNKFLKLRKKHEGQKEKPEGQEEKPEGQEEKPEGQEEKPEGQEENPEGQEEKIAHSVKVPDLYRKACKILKRYELKEGALKTLVYQGRYRNYAAIFALLSKAIDNEAIIKTAIASSNLLAEQPEFDPYLARVFTAQFLSKGAVNGDSKPMVVFRQYQDKIRDIAESSFVKEKNLEDAMPRYVRVNTLVGGMSRVQAQLKEDGFVLENYDAEDESYDDFLQRVNNLVAPNYLMDYHIPDLLVFPPDAKFWGTPLYKNNVIIIQNKASCLPVHLSNVGEMRSVIDACAAPGNKTSLMAAKMNGQGKVMAVEMDSKRFKTMKKLLAIRQAKYVNAVNKDFFKVSPTDHDDAECIFVDPSCSSSGTDIHGDEVSRERVTKLASLQVALLKHALSFPNVKEVIYSTCSVLEEENEQVVDDVLKVYQKDFELANLGNLIKGWKHFGHPRYEFGDKCVRTNTSIDRCSGFFVAKFVRRNVAKSGKRKSGELEKSTIGESNNLEEQSSKTPKKKSKKKKLIEKNLEITNEESSNLEEQSSKTSPKKKSKKKKLELEKNLEITNEESSNLEEQSSKTSPKKKSKKKKLEVA